MSYIDEDECGSGEYTARRDVDATSCYHPWVELITPSMGSLILVSSRFLFRPSQLHSRLNHADDVVLADPAM